MWQGKATSDADTGRSVPLRAFAPLCHIPGVKLISLQKNHGLEQLAHLPPGMSVETLGAEFDAGPDAFMDCAAVMMNLDLVISCDTAAAHLAGALGRPVWIVLKHVPDWRWMMDREDTPWYPTARLFRQARRGDWDEVFLRIASELARAAAAETNSQDLLPQQRADSLDSIQAVPLGTALVPVSFGELVDKITILEIKSERIGDFSKLINVRVELDLLTTALSRFCVLPSRAGELKAELQQINEALWEIEDQIRDCERRNDFGAKFVDLARRVYMTNDRRSAVKRQLNQLAGSVIVEEKSYIEAYRHSASLISLIQAHPPSAAGETSPDKTARKKFPRRACERRRFIFGDNRRFIGPPGATTGQRDRDGFRRGHTGLTMSVEPC